MKVLSLDTETTGLENPFDDEKGAKLIQFSCVPAEVNNEGYLIKDDLVFDVYIKCPSFDILKPYLNPWVIEHNKELIDIAHEKGLEILEFQNQFKSYLDNTIKDFFGDEEVIVLGKSLPSLDFLIMVKNLGYDFLREYDFLRNYIDINPILRFMIEKKQINITDISSKNLMKYFGFGEDVKHLAYTDAIDMIKIYHELLKI